MKTIIFLIAILSISGCKQMYSDVSGEKKDDKIYVITIDSCEYVVLDGMREAGITHKGNCKNHAN